MHSEQVQGADQADKRKQLQDMTDDRNDARASLLQANTDLADEKALGVRTKATLTSREDFLAIVSHDLRSPLSVIAMSAERLMDQNDASENPEIKLRLLEMIRRNAAVMERLIADLLDAERIASNKLVLKMAYHDINEIVRDAIESFRPIAVAKGITILDQLSQTHCIVDCDADRVAQILTNLLTNAIKFTPSGGVITVESARQFQRVSFAVADTGPGIPEAMQRQIFDRYSQVGRDDRRGLGLGLYISNWLVEAHAGRIWVESVLGHGSRFCVELPDLAG